MATIQSTLDVTNLDLFKDLVNLLSEFAESSPDAKQRLSEVFAKHNYTYKEE